ncbi:alpha-amylase family protein [Limnovirga soli]|uniref:Beta-galactosidase trimerisation domain-containing protein n=1 Tax=Limnovirga soli TaxID=2656915 RepID=A0A8J8JVQ0_9BACT|nr:alpha-amylase family protein [Limnovirga soli]NNV56869.1 hypothetical protein [Limnovirga soli]
MKNLVWIFFCIGTSAQAQTLTRANSFVGLHFDFHAGFQSTHIGQYFSYEAIDSMLSLTKPDYIQVDCKGHPGIASYPTKVGTPAPDIDKDIMLQWRQLTNKHHVALFVHYSGIWDYNAVAQHPGWARVNSDGKPDAYATSVFGPYADSLLIPQLKELALKYKVDGAWVDGDCWTLAPDYGTVAAAAFTKATGITTLPIAITDSNYFALAEFNRRQFHTYVSNYVNALHKASPGFQITSNWSFSSFIPEKVDVPVDFLSGDVAGSNSLYSSAFESRCMALQGKPWDLMSWSFSNKDNFRGTKPFVQLAQEAAEVIAMGGGYQTYWTQNADGSLPPHLFGNMQQIIAFCRQRQAYTHKAAIVPQVGLLYSSYAWRRIPSEGLYNGGGSGAIKGILAALLDNQLPVEIIMDHQLPERINQYPVLVFPEWQTIDPAQHALLLQYVNNGGHLLVIGADAASLFKEQLGANTYGKKPEGEMLHYAFNYNSESLQSALQKAVALPGTQTIGYLLQNYDLRFPDSLAMATVANYGKGKIAAIYANIGDAYTHRQSAQLRDMVGAAMQTLFAQPTVTVQGSKLLHMVLAKKDGHLFIHLINSGGGHSNPNITTYSEVAPVGAVTLTIRLPKKPASLVLQPSHTILPFSYANGVATVKLRQVGIYEIIQVNE